MLCGRQLLLWQGLPAGCRLFLAPSAGAVCLQTNNRQMQVGLLLLLLLLLLGKQVTCSRCAVVMLGKPLNTGAALCLIAFGLTMTCCPQEGPWGS
jgi:hypothetical protein